MLAKTSISTGAKVGKLSALKKIVATKFSKLFLALSTTLAWFFSTYTDLWFAIKLFCLATVLDTISSIHKGSKAQKLKFKPWKLYFWKQIKSEYLRVWMIKIFYEYAILLIIIFAVDIWVFKNALQFELLTLKLNPPIFALYIFSAIEIWSIFENLEEAGHKNILKMGINWFSDFIPEKYKKVLKKADKDLINKNKNDE